MSYHVVGEEELIMHEVWAFILLSQVSSIFYFQCLIGLGVGVTAPL